jgi:transposase
MRRRRVYSIELKRRAVSRVLSGETVSVVAAEEKIWPTRLYDWVGKARLGRLEPVRGPGRPTKDEALRRAASEGRLLDKGSAAERRISELERKIAQQELDLDFFRQALRHVKARQQADAGRGAPRSTKSSKR